MAGRLTAGRTGAGLGAGNLTWFGECGLCSGVASHEDGARDGRAAAGLWGDGESGRRTQLQWWGLGLITCWNVGALQAVEIGKRVNTEACRVNICW